MTSPYLWFSIQIQMTCSYDGGGSVCAPHGDDAGSVVVGAVELAAASAEAGEDFREFVLEENDLAVGVEQVVRDFVPGPAGGVHQAVDQRFGEGDAHAAADAGQRRSKHDGHRE